MDRVAFILPDGSRIGCMLNPEHIVHRRAAGIAPRRTGAGVVAGPALSDTPLLHTGGGRTELELQLLFDVDLLPAPAIPTAPPASLTSEDGTPVAPPPPTTPPRRDVRDLTRPLWNLAENSDAEGRGVPEVRFLFGKSWNMLAVVEALAERFERFDASGTPGRSWLSMRLVRVPDPNPPAPVDTESAEIPGPEAVAAAAAAPLALHRVIGAGDTEGDPPAGGETLADIAARYFDGQSALWRWLASVNLLDDEVVWPEPGRELIIPPAPADLQREDAR